MHASFVAVEIQIYMALCANAHYIAAIIPHIDTFLTYTQTKYNPVILQLILVTVTVTVTVMVTVTVTVAETLLKY